MRNKYVGLVLVKFGFKMSTLKLDVWTSQLSVWPVSKVFIRNNTDNLHLYRDLFSGLKGCPRLLPAPHMAYTHNTIPGSSWPCKILKMIFFPCQNVRTALSEILIINCFFFSWKGLNIWSVLGTRLWGSVPELKYTHNLMYPNSDPKFLKQFWRMVFLGGALCK